MNLLQKNSTFCVDGKIPPDYIRPTHGVAALWRRPVQRFRYSRALQRLTQVRQKRLPVADIVKSSSDVAV